MKHPSSEIQSRSVMVTGATNFLSTQIYNSSRPKAFINWILLDEQFKYYAGGFEQVGSDEELKIHTISRNSATKSGYLYVYACPSVMQWRRVSNETTNIPVYFDNLQVTHYRGPVLEETHYYPFGTKMAGISSQAMNFGQPGNKYLFGGKEQQSKEFSDGSGLETYDYGSRMYDNQIGRWYTADPMAHKFPWQSPYIAMDDNPILKTDPTGMSAAPIYDQEGNLLGTDDQGLKGKAIVMDKKDFQQGMKHEDALNKNLGVAGLKDDKAASKLVSSYNSLPSRPDYDGKLTLNEANKWYREGNGQPLYLDVSNIELSPIYKGDLKVGQSKYVNYESLDKSTFGNLGTGLVFGTIKLTLLNADGTVHIGGKKGFVDNYGFEYQKGRYMRNVLTWAGKTLAGSGTPYDIFGYGKAQLKDRPKMIPEPGTLEFEMVR